VQVLRLRRARKVKGAAQDVENGRQDAWARGKDGFGEEQGGFRPGNAGFCQEQAALLGVPFHARLFVGLPIAMGNSDAALQAGARRTGQAGHMDEGGLVEALDLACKADAPASCPGRSFPRRERSARILCHHDAMLACVDVDYRPAEAVAACVLFHDWPDSTEAGTLVAHLPPAAPYQPGQFYLRELPCLLQVLRRATCPLDVVVIDGYVWLGEGEPGLGAHLHRELGVPVIGVAKTAFHGSRQALKVQRGQSSKPLHVSAAALDPAEAARAIQAMHGPHRIPTLLKRVDRLCRDG
jgi:deoxyribonuclease V